MKNRTKKTKGKCSSICLPFGVKLWVSKMVDVYCRLLYSIFLPPWEKLKPLCLLLESKFNVMTIASVAHDDHLQHLRFMPFAFFVLLRKTFQLFGFQISCFDEGYSLNGASALNYILCISDFIISPPFLKNLNSLILTY